MLDNILPIDIRHNCYVIDLEYCPRPREVANNFILFLKLFDKNAKQLIEDNLYDIGYIGSAIFSHDDNFHPCSGDMGDIEDGVDNMSGLPVTELPYTAFLNENFAEILNS